MGDNVCKDKIDSEVHLVANCPLYNEEWIKLYGLCRNVRKGMKFYLIPTDEQKFILICYSYILAVLN